MHANEGQLRKFRATDDKEDRSLERQDPYKEIVKRCDIEKSNCRHTHLEMQRKKKLTIVVFHFCNDLHHKQHCTGMKIYSILGHLSTEAGQLLRSGQWAGLKSISNGQFIYCSLKSPADCLSLLLLPIFRILIMSTCFVTFGISFETSNEEGGDDDDDAFDGAGVCCKSSAAKIL
ncbi:hypothetical protein Tsp_03280 [Trichinella spiralis]|uniref:hypothetical protein n=1 Tax=Trichinella spiralis TaxID=6334 RepID=UPI0001EFC5A3|nr:hypothetical protein Tsp_03280 [Trichinella spiralis]